MTAIILIALLEQKKENKNTEKKERKKKRDKRKKESFHMNQTVDKKEIRLGRGMVEKKMY